MRGGETLWGDIFGCRKLKVEGEAETRIVDGFMVGEGGQTSRVVA